MKRRRSRHPSPEFSPDVRRAHQERTTLFEQALEQITRDTDWSCENLNLSMQEGDWLARNMLFLHPFSGVKVRWTYKPAAFVPLFYEILRSDQSNTLPLTGSDNSALLLRPFLRGAYLSEDESDPKRLAHDMLAWSNARLGEFKGTSLEQMLGQLGRLEITSGGERSIAVCLLILLKRFDEALDLCVTKYDPYSAAPIWARGEVFDHGTFLDCAQAWLLKR